MQENGRTVCQHLIVENKAPWMALFPHLPETTFTSLVLGYGWKILASIDQLPAQCGYPQAHHFVWYFGDFDWEGLRIWHELAKKCETRESIELRLAIPFYVAFLAHPESRGKEHQPPLAWITGGTDLILRNYSDQSVAASVWLVRYGPGNQMRSAALLSQQTLTGGARITVPQEDIAVSSDETAKLLVTGDAFIPLTQALDIEDME